MMPLTRLAMGARAAMPATAAKIAAEASMARASEPIPGSCARAIAPPTKSIEIHTRRRIMRKRVRSEGPGSRLSIATMARSRRASSASTMRATTMVMSRYKAALNQGES